MYSEWQLKWLGKNSTNHKEGALALALNQILQNNLGKYHNTAKKLGNAALSQQAHIAGQPTREP